MLERLFLSMLSMSISVGILLLCLLFLMPWFRSRTTPLQRRFLWVILAFRLLLPFPAFLSFAAPISLSNVPFTYEAGRPGELTAAPLPGENAPPTTAPQTDSTVPRRAVAPLFCLCVAWLVGAAAFVFYQSIGYWLLRRRLLRWSTSPETPETLLLLQSVSTELKLRRAPLLMVNHAAESPLVFGYFRPVLILPAETYAETDMRFILQHELTHIKQGDVWIKLFLIAANAVHWFNPLLYWLRREASADLELACDDRVLAGRTFAERRAYSETILTSMKTRRKQRQTLTTQFYGGVRTMKRRLLHIMEPEKNRRGAWLVAAVMVCMLLLGSLIACTAYTPPQWIDGKLDMGSLFDHVQIDHKSVRVRGLSQNMKLQDVMDYYGLKEEDTEIVTYEDGDRKSVLIRLRNVVSFEEERDYPWTLYFYFDGETDRLSRVMLGVQYIGASWQVAHEHAMKIFEQINEKGGKAITSEEWMQNYDYKGMVYNDLADPLESLSELDTHFMRQYMYSGSKNNSGFSLSMSYQDFSHADTTEGLGQDVDDLFGLSINIPIKNT